MVEDSVIVIGGGIAGLTAGALLAKQGMNVTLFESHKKVGGCSGTFVRGPFIFDVGATQVAGLEPGGIHERIFRHLGLSIPDAELLDPACVINLADGSDSIHLWHDPDLWKQELLTHFPDTEVFWQLCGFLHKRNWAFSLREPVLPPRSTWDFLQMAQAFRPTMIPSGLFSPFSVFDLVKLCGCHKDQRFRKFLDLQLRLYSQEPADRTAALYGATVLQMPKAPLGLWHLKGSMQRLSELLKSALINNGGRVFIRSRVVELGTSSYAKRWSVKVLSAKGNMDVFYSSDVICSLPPQCLIDLIPSDSGLPASYIERLLKLPKPTGALVFYGAVNRAALPVNCPAHVQLASKELGSLFISISRDGDGRAPVGKATLIASLFAETKEWNLISDKDYQNKKNDSFLLICKALEEFFGFSSNDWLHRELATPRSFAKWTGRPEGIVGGLGQHQSIFGLLGLASRTPMRGLWLCGDSIYPGEGTAGVSQSALMACRQLMAAKGKSLKVDL